jgi:glutamate 5-kinase
MKKNTLKSKKNIVIKIGSALLVDNGEVNKKWLRSFTKNVADLMKQKVKVTLVSSGAIALGRKHFDHGQKLSLQEKQASAAIGQIELMSVYRDFFEKLNVEVAQILLTASDCNSRERYLNCKNTIETLHGKNILPIINENDSVAVEEIKIGDNDRLSARVAQMVSADLTILFSDIDGLYDKNPKKYFYAKLIKEVHKIDESIEKMAEGAVSKVGTGGMITKIMAAKMLNNSGCDVVITDGRNKDAVSRLFLNKQNYTIFYNEGKAHKSRKKWLSGILGGNIKGELIVNAKAKEKLLSAKISLLPIGVIATTGNFTKGDLVLVKDENDEVIARGISNYSTSDTAKILQKKSTEVKKILGKNAKEELVHIDNLVVI